MQNTQVQVQQQTTVSPSPAMRLVKLAPDFEAQLKNAYSESYEYEPQVLEIRSETYDDIDGEGTGWISQFEPGAYSDNYIY